MSVRAQALVWQADIKDSTKKFILIKLADYADDEGVCWPSVESICRYTGLSERQVRKDISEMVRDGWINILRNGYSNGKGVPGTPNMIRLALDVIGALPAIVPVKARYAPLSPQSPGCEQPIPSDGRVQHETTNQQGAADAPESSALLPYSSVISSAVTAVVTASERGSLTDKEVPALSLTEKSIEYPLDADTLVALWNRYPFIKARGVRRGSDRAEMVRLAIAERPWPSAWEVVFTRMVASPWLKGTNGHAWKPDFDWILKPENIDKVLEGKYDSRDVTPKERAAQIADGIRSALGRGHSP